MNKCPVTGHKIQNAVIKYWCHELEKRRKDMARVMEYTVQNLIGSNVKKYRIERKLSQQGLAERLETYAVYICRGSISRIETHTRTVTDFELQALSKALNVSMEALFEESHDALS